MRFFHYSNGPIAFDASRTYVQETHWKPVGFWLSVDNDWQRWCESEDFRNESLSHKTEFHFTPEANILYLRTPENIDAFTRLYADLTQRYTHIDWSRVARDYQGIIIAPYQWERRLANWTSWYYTWDCASGCVWDLTALREVDTLSVDTGGSDDKILCSDGRDAVPCD